MPLECGKDLILVLVKRWKSHFNIFSRLLEYSILHHFLAYFSNIMSIFSNILSNFSNILSNFSDIMSNFSNVESKFSNTYVIKEIV